LKTLIFISLLIVSFASEAEFLYPNSIELIENDIEENGLHYVSRKLLHGHRSREKFLSHLKKGEKRYIDVGYKLLDVADGSISEDLRMAFAHSLVNNPKHIVPLIKEKGKLNYTNMCTLPFWSDWSADSSTSDVIKHEKEILSYVTKLIEVLNSLTAKEYSQYKNKCLIEMKDIKEDKEIKINNLTMRSRLPVKNTGWMLRTKRAAPLT